MKDKVERTTNSVFQHSKPKFLFYIKVLNYRRVNVSKFHVSNISVKKTLGVSGEFVKN